MRTTELNSLASGIGILATPVLLLNAGSLVVLANPAAESLFGSSAASFVDQPVSRLFALDRADGTAFSRLVLQARAANSSFTENDLALSVGEHLIHVACTATPVLEDLTLIEFYALDQARKIAREENLLEHQRLNQDLIRNLAHEIRNPLGGIRGAAQLLHEELTDPAQTEYTEVIIKEVDRLRSLLDRLLTPHRIPRIALVNIHSVLEHVRTIIHAEYGDGVVIERDYDISLPELNADREQLIQATLNVARNAAQAMNGRGVLRLVTRIARQVTIAKRRYRQAIEVRIIDNGPGVPAHLADQIFYPLVTGREGGSGLGLSLAQSLVNQHAGVIEFESAPQKTCFVIVLPLTPSATSTVA